MIVLLNRYRKANYKIISVTGQFELFEETASFAEKVNAYTPRAEMDSSNDLGDTDMRRRRWSAMTVWFLLLMFFLVDMAEYFA